MRHVARQTVVTRVLATCGLLALLAGCGGGAKTVENPVTSGGAPPTYSGPPPATADVQSFKVNVWDNLKASNRCGQCHTQGGQAPQFVRQDDVNLAYAAANGVVTLDSPRDSRMVTKVAGGHNCWLASAAACADILTTWITNWAGATAGGAAAVELKPPPLRDPGASKKLPGRRRASSPPRSIRCSRSTARAAITQSAANAQSPFFASSDVNEAYAAVRVKINLDQPEMSRLVVRLRSEFHNCWSDCAANSSEMEAAIRAFAGSIVPTQVDPSLVLSKALKLYDGTVASGGNRYNGNVIGLWEFKTGSGSVAYDTSGVEPALNLNLSGDVDLGRRLGHQRQARQGAGLHGREPQAPRPHQGHRRVLDRGLGGTRQRRAGGRADRVLLGRHRRRATSCSARRSTATTSTTGRAPPTSPATRSSPRRPTTRTCRRRCSTSSRPTTRSTGDAST